jgi:phosphate uptake regulator
MSPDLPLQNLLPAGIEQNFRFIALEVQKQVSDTFQYLQTPGPDLAERIEGRDDYIDTLKSLIEDKTYRLLRGLPHADRKT